MLVQVIIPITEWDKAQENYKKQLQARPCVVPLYVYAMKHYKIQLICCAVEVYDKVFPVCCTRQTSFPDI